MNIDPNYAVGNTPLIRLRHLSEATGCEILGKAEFLNPGGSIKDRAALGMMQAAEQTGALRPGGVIVEGTAGNTGAGFALHGPPRGYRVCLVIPDTLSPEKKHLLRALGAEVREAPPRPYGHADHFQQVARRLAEATPGAWWANQFDNPANRRTHFETTGPEIWSQTAGRVTDFVAAVGSGGTIAGVGLALKQRNPRVRVVCADSHGAGVWSWVKRGHFEDVVGESVAEGIGQLRMTGNLAEARIDDAHRIGDPEALGMLQHLLRREGVFVGLSSAINVCAALREARAHGPGRVIATMLCDGGLRYASTLFDPAWLHAHQLVATAPDLPVALVERGNGND